jgi:hypothetical protein
MFGSRDKTGGKGLGMFYLLYLPIVASISTGAIVG